MSQKRSRVNKFAQLRDEIMNESSDKIETKELSIYADKLHQVDNQQFESMNVNPQHEPLHLRQHDYYGDSVEVEEEIPLAEIEHERMDELFEKSSEAMIEDTDSFKSDYLSDFINEAKQYNVEKGFRVDHDTRSNLLRELKAQQIYVEEDELEPQEIIEVDEDEVIETLTDNDLFEEPQSQVEETVEFKVEEAIDEQEETDEFEETIMMRVAQLANQEMNTQDYTDFDVNSSDLLEATTKLKVQLDQQSAVVKDMKTKIDKTNRSLNVALTFLIICLVVLIAVFGYFLLKLYQVI